MAANRTSRSRIIAALSHGTDRPRASYSLLQTIIASVADAMLNEEILEVCFTREINFMLLRLVICIKGKATEVIRELMFT